MKHFQQKTLALELGANGVYIDASATLPLPDSGLSWITSVYKQAINVAVGWNIISYVSDG